MLLHRRSAPEQLEKLGGNPYPMLFLTEIMDIFSETAIEKLKIALQKKTEISDFEHFRPFLPTKAMRTGCIS